MRLWTIQTDAAYRILQETGKLSGTRGTVIEESFLPAYDWLRKQMSQRIGPPPTPEAYPIWGWYQYEGRSGKPDMRRFRNDLRAAGPAGLWRLKLEVPDEQVLLSDFDLWHFPLNRWYLSVSEEDYDAHDTCTQEEMEKSWELIFHLDMPANDWNSAPQKTIQGTFWELTQYMVVAAEHFVRG